jgi:hypothetical protein
VRLRILLVTKGNLINKGCNAKAVRITRQLPSANLFGLGNRFSVRIGRYCANHECCRSEV